MNLQEKISWMESKKSKNMDLVDYQEIMDQYLPYHKKLKKNSGGWNKREGQYVSLDGFNAGRTGLSSWCFYISAFNRS